MSVLIGLLMALASLTTTATVYEDGSGIFIAEWTTPSCPDMNDEPCYLVITTDEFGTPDIDFGP